MSRLDRYHDPMTAPQPPPLPRKGILMSPPPPPPNVTPLGVNLGRQFNMSGPMSLPWGGTTPGKRATVSGSRQWAQEMPRKGPKVSPWGTTEPPSVLGMGSGDRIRPERTGRKPIQKLQFSTDTEGGESSGHGTMDGKKNLSGKHQGGSLGRRSLASLSIADMSPRLALQRILALYERGEHREAAAFLRRLSTSTFRQIVTELPTDLFVDSLPQALPILEALYAKLFLAGGKKLATAANASPETVIWQLVKFFASQEDQTLATREGRWEFCGPFINTCKRLLGVLLTAEPRLRRLVAERKKALTKAIEGLGQHGMVGTSDQSLMNLHDALKLEFDKIKENYVVSLAKLEELALSSKEPVTNSGGCKAPVSSSHQRQLSLKTNEVQERLIKNKTLLNVVEPVLGCTSLEVLLGILQRRVELDKEVLFQFTQIKREAKIVDQTDKNPTIAPALMRFQRGCHQVLELMREVREDDDGGNISDISGNSGYHSDSDSTVMMSGNSPFVSKSARYNFLSRSVRLGSKHSARISMVAAELALESSSGYKSLQESSSSGFSSLPSSGASGSSATPPDSTSPSHSASSSQDSDSGSSMDREVDRKTPRPNRGRVKKFKTENGRNTAMGGLLSDLTIPEAPLIAASNVQDDPKEVVRIKAELLKLKEDLASARQTIVRMHDREEKTKERLMDLRLREEQISISSASSVYLAGTSGKVKAGDAVTTRVKAGTAGEATLTRGKQEATLTRGKQDRRTASSLVAKYGEMYSQARLDTLDALDDLLELSNADELKNKLLFSVVVLSFRSATASLATLKSQFRKVLQLPDVSTSSTTEPHIMEIEAAFDDYLRKASARFKLDKNYEEVLSQICGTLFDYPCLRNCKELIKYITNCVNTAWGLSTQVPQYVIEYEVRSFRSDIHVRFHTSKGEGEAVRTYIWPALLEGKDGPCVHKAVVVTCVTPISSI